jgi:hypothetical protein
MDLAGADGEVHPVQDRLIRHAGVEITDLKQNRSFGADHGGAGGADLDGREAANVAARWLKRSPEPEWNVDEAKS